MGSQKANELWSADASGRAAVEDILIICRHVVANLLINTSDSWSESVVQLSCLLLVIRIWSVVRCE